MIFFLLHFAGIGMYVKTGMKGFPVWKKFAVVARCRYVCGGVLCLNA